MKTKKPMKFWAWKNQAAAEENAPAERVLELYGTIAEQSWFDDDITPAMFRDELFAGDGPITIWINSPGGDCIAASQIYTMLMDYKGNVTVKIDGIAASAASVIAMAGTTVLMAPTALMMIHNPATIAAGDHNDMQKAIEMLDEVKESIKRRYADNLFKFVERESKHHEQFSQFHRREFYGRFGKLLSGNALRGIEWNGIYENHLCEFRTDYKWFYLL